MLPRIVFWLYSAQFYQVFKVLTPGRSFASVIRICHCASFIPKGTPFFC